MYLKISASFWNSPEGCVSVVTDYAANGSLQNLCQSVGALPENILKQIAKSVLKSIHSMHEQGLTHTNISSS